YIQNNTKLGFCLYFVGTNSKAAEFSGINNVKTIITSYAIGGCLAAVAGMILSSRSMSARMDYGSIYQLQAILAVVLGGISPSGGKGKVLGVVLAVMSLQVLSTGLNIMNFASTSYLKNLVWGFLLLIVLVVKYFINKK
ncbi:MAG: ABC transporter permease, partial [Eubacteriales bacterium]|nr:ABC transporter permease [Eubacteriales bacterium]